MRPALAGSGSHPGDDVVIAAVPVRERGRVGGYPAGGAVDRVQVHGRMTGRQLRAVLDVYLDRRVGDLAEEVGPPVPLQPGRVEAVEGALQHGERHRLQAYR